MLTTRKLVVGTADRSLIEIEPYVPAGEEAQAVALGGAELAGLAPLLQQAPGLFGHVHRAASNTYVLRFAPEVQRRLADGSASIMRAADGGLRAIAVDEQGRVIGNGTLIPDAGASGVAIGAAIWQVLAIVTAQHYLSDIQRRLARIEAGINDIKRWLETKEIATLVENFKFLHSIGQFLEGQRLRDLADVLPLRCQVEKIDVESGAAFAIFRQAMRAEYHTFEQANLYDTFNVQAPLAQACQLVAEFERLARIGLIAVTVKVAAAEIRCALHGDPAWALHRLQEAQRDLASWNTERRQFFTLVKRRTPELWAPVALDIYNVEAREKLAAQAGKAQTALRKRYAEAAAMTNSSIEKITTQIAAEACPLELLVTLDDQGQMTEMRRLLPVFAQ